MGNKKSNKKNNNNTNYAKYRVHDVFMESLISDIVKLNPYADPNVLRKKSPMFLMDYKKQLSLSKCKKETITEEKHTLKVTPLEELFINSRRYKLIKNSILDGSDFYYRIEAKEDLGFDIQLSRTSDTVCDSCKIFKGMVSGIIGKNVSFDIPEDKTIDDIDFWVNEDSKIDNVVIGNKVYIANSNIDMNCIFEKCFVRGLMAEYTNKNFAKNTKEYIRIYKSIVDSDLRFQHENTTAIITNSYIKVCNSRLRCHTFVCNSSSITGSINAYFSVILEDTVMKDANVFLANAKLRKCEINSHVSCRFVNCYLENTDVSGNAIIYGDFNSNHLLRDKTTESIYVNNSCILYTPCKVYIKNCTIRGNTTIAGTVSINGSSGEKHYKPLPINNCIICNNSNIEYSKLDSKVMLSPKYNNQYSEPSIISISVYRNTDNSGISNSTIVGNVIIQASTELIIDNSTIRMHSNSFDRNRSIVMASQWIRIKFSNIDYHSEGLEIDAKNEISISVSNIINNNKLNKAEELIPNMIGCYAFKCEDSNLNNTNITANVYMSFNLSYSDIKNTYIFSSMNSCDMYNRDICSEQVCFNNVNIGEDEGNETVIRLVQEKCTDFPKDIESKVKFKNLIRLDRDEFSRHVSFPICGNEYIVKYTWRPTIESGSITSIDCLQLKSPEFRALMHKLNKYNDNKDNNSNK